MYFFPDESKPITSEMIRQDCTPDAVEALRVTRIDGQAASTDVAVSVCGCVASIASACGIAALAGFTLPILVPIATLGVSALSAWNAKVTQRDREEEAVFLSEHPEILDLIKQKIDAGEDRARIAGAYEVAIEAYFHGQSEPLKCLGYWKSEALPSSPTAMNPTMAPYPVDPETQPSQAIGANTRLGAVTVASSPAAQTAATATNALSALLKSPFLSRAWFGAQRTGKSYLAAVASLELSKRGIKIYHLNLASFGDEDAVYWQHAVKSVRADLSSLDEMTAQPFIDEAISLVHEFFSTRNAILIFDEITLTGSLSNQHAAALDPLLRLVADKIACLASTGTKRAQAIWTLSPDFVAGSLSQQVKAIKSLALVFVAIAPGRSVDWNGNRIGFHAEAFGNVQRNFPVLTMPSSNAGCDRICFVDGHWLPVGELPSLPKFEPVLVASPIKTEDSNITYPISEIAALRGIDRPSIGTDESAQTESKVRPEALDRYPMVKAVCLYLEGKEPRNLKQIADTMKTCKKISDEDLQQGLGDAYTNYKDGVLKVLFFGVTQKLIKQVSQDTYTVNY